jgi:hypothetical protein
VNSVMILSIPQKGGELLDQLRDNQFLQKGSVSEVTFRHPFVRSKGSADGTSTCAIMCHATCQVERS